MRYTKLRDSIIVITFVYGKTLKQSMIDKKIGDKEAERLRKIHNRCVDIRSDFMKNTQFKDNFSCITK